VTGRSLWLRVLVSTAIALTLLLTLSPPQPNAQLPLPLALAIGLCGGIVLFVAATGRRPRLGRDPSPVPLLVARNGVLGLLAANEEIVWRRVLLGELLAGGAFAALAISAVAFSLAHRARRALHFATGVAFGLVYLATGALTASIVAHWTYNALVAGWAGQSSGGSEADI
jgi:membrane protease YdiL (CAAX protease family)